MDLTNPQIIITSLFTFLHSILILQQMEPQTISEIPTLDFSSTVDTSRPFRSVKEAIAILDERLLVGEIYPPKPFSDTAYSPIKQEASWRFSSPTPSPTKPKDDNGNGNALLDTLKKLEAELEETKVELKLLKERGNDTEVALATLNAELHKNMSKLAQAEAAAAGKAAVATKTVRFEIENGGGGDRKDEEIREDEKKREYIRWRKESQTLAQILSLGEKDHYFGRKRERKTMKKKPIIPLVGDLFFKKKGSSTKRNS